MKTSVLSARSPSQAQAACEQAAALLGRGAVISFPTDTFYALGANATDEKAIAKIYRLKGRQTRRPILILVHDTKEAERWVQEISPVARRLMQSFWPGPLTLVFGAAPCLPMELTGGTATVGVRVPGHWLAREIARLAKVPITGTSANPSGSRAAASAEEVLGYFEGRIHLVVDGGEARHIAASTVVSVVEPQPRILRVGKISRDAILRAVGSSDV